MSSKAQIGVVEEVPVAAKATTERRERLVRILFVHRSPRDVERCVRELKRMRYTVSSDVVLTPKQFAERLQTDVYDVIVAEYPNPSWEERQALDVMQEMEKSVSLVYLLQGAHRESAAELMLEGAADCVDMESIGRLPAAVNRALREKVLREQRDRAERELRRSEARYRALVGNQSYGICRCNRDGEFLEVNEAMVRMLGYDAAEEVLGQGLARELIQDPARRAHLLGQSHGGAPAERVEIGWVRKDRRRLKVRLSGREVLDERGALEAYELIAEDVTEQRELEDHLRRQAASDSLTGLANYRCLVEVLHSEIRRSKRTNRQFALLLFDVDGLKAINDRHGHMIGSQALCRLADVLLSCCRDIDTSARFGGDEFALVLPEANAAAARQVAQRICENLANDHKGPRVSVSVGLSVYPEDGDTIERLLCEADSGLYARKMQRAQPADGGCNGAGTHR